MSKKKFIHEFIIDRSMWSNGHNEHNASLENEDGMKCCLGFLAESCGVPKKHRLDVGYPSCVDDSVRGAKRLYKLLNDSAAHYENKFIEVNDRSNGTRKQREQRLTTLFADNGIKVKFVGKYTLSEG